MKSLITYQIKSIVIKLRLLLWFDSLATSLPVAQWLERPTGVREVMGSIPVGDSDFFFVPRS